VSVKRDGPGHRTLRLALLWFALVIACAGLARHLLILESRIQWEQEVRSGVGEDMAVYEVRDPVAWAGHQRRVDARIAALRSEQGLTRALFFGVAVIGLGVTMWLFWPQGAQRTRTGKAQSR
jgi:hypothetical protein